MVRRLLLTLGPRSHLAIYILCRCTEPNAVFVNPPRVAHILCGFQNRPQPTRIRSAGLRSSLRACYSRDAFLYRFFCDQSKKLSDHPSLAYVTVVLKLHKTGTPCILHSVAQTTLNRNPICIIKHFCIAKIFIELYNVINFLKPLAQIIFQRILSKILSIE